MTVKSLCLSDSMAAVIRSQCHQQCLLEVPWEYYNGVSEVYCIFF